MFLEVAEKVGEFDLVPAPDRLAFGPVRESAEYSAVGFLGMLGVAALVAEVLSELVD